jgi:hypothetical protein
MERAITILGIVGILVIWGTDIFVTLWKLIASFLFIMPPLFKATQKKLAINFQSVTNISVPQITRIPTIPKIVIALSII